MLHQIDLETGVGQIERRLNAGDAAALHQHRADYLILSFSMIHYLH